MIGRDCWIGVLLACLALGGCDGKSGTQANSQPANGGNDASSSPGSTQQGAQEKGGAKANDTVRIPAADQQRAGIRTADVEVRSVPRTLSVGGQVTLDEQHTSHLGTLADGRIIAVNVLPGALVHRGQMLGTLHSHMVHETVGALIEAFAAVDRQQSALAFAQAARERYTHLYSIQAASLEESQRADQQVQQARNLLTDAEASVHMEREHLSELLQVEPASLTPKNLYDRELIPIRAATDGTVIARNITVGQVVNTGFEAFTISNLSNVWVSASVNERDLSVVTNGARAQITTQGYPGQTFNARVTMVGSYLDPQTRTIPVRIAVPNARIELRPGMFATAQIAEPSTRAAIFAPEEALQDINGLQVVFTTVDGSIFRARTVTVGMRSEGRVEILDGLQPNDRIVIAGAFMVKSEMLKGTMGDG